MSDQISLGGEGFSDEMIQVVLGRLVDGERQTDVPVANDVRIVIDRMIGGRMSELFASLAHDGVDVDGPIRGKSHGGERPQE
jgi:hypothetical protein